MLRCILITFLFTTYVGCEHSNIETQVDEFESRVNSTTLPSMPTDEANTVKALDAEVLLRQAMSIAKSQDKNILVHIGRPGCKGCRVLESFLKKNQSLFDDSYTLLKVDIDSMEKGEDVAARLRDGREEAGIPWMVILDAEGKSLITSDGPNGNIGFPVLSYEVEHFMEMIRTTSSLSQQRYLKISQALQNYGRPYRPDAEPIAKKLGAPLSVTSEGPEDDSAALPAPTTLLQNYEKTLLPFQRFKATWINEDYRLKPGRKPELESTQEWTICRADDQARLFSKQTDGQGNSTNYEDVIHNRKKWVSIYPGGIVMSKINVPAEDFPERLGLARAAPCYGVIGQVSIPDFLQMSKLTVETSFMELDTVYVLRGETEAMIITLWLDPSLGYVARKIEYENRSQKHSGQFEVKRFQQEADVSVVAEATWTIIQPSKPLMSARAGTKLVDGKEPAKDKSGKVIMMPEKRGFSKIKLVEISFEPQFSDVDFKLSQPIVNGTRVNMQDDRGTKYVWQDGSILRQEDEDTDSRTN